MDCPEPRPVQPPGRDTVIELPEMADCITTTNGWPPNRGGSLSARDRFAGRTGPPGPVLRTTGRVQPMCSAPSVGIAKLELWGFVGLAPQSESAQGRGCLLAAHVTRSF